jgi:hypothetical protein
VKRPITSAPRICAEPSMVLRCASNASSLAPWRAVETRSYAMNRGIGVDMEGCQRAYARFAQLDNNASPTSLNPIMHCDLKPKRAIASLSA